MKEIERIKRINQKTKSEVELRRIRLDLENYQKWRFPDACRDCNKIDSVDFLEWLKANREDILAILNFLNKTEEAESAQ